MIEIAAENFERKNEINKLLKLSKDKEEIAKIGSEETKDGESIIHSNVYDDLKKIKDLHDTGVLTEEMYNSEKQRLTALLESSSIAKPEKPKYNVIIIREKKRTFGEYRTIAIIDGKKRKELDLDKVQTNILLPLGKHTIVFKRGAVRSKKLSFTISDGTKQKIYFTPNNFSISAALDN